MSESGVLRTDPDVHEDATWLRFAGGSAVTYAGRCNCGTDAGPLYGTQQELAQEP
eukprot:XP_001690383.1 predicted protein [Chlamydomonas reinhardtii]